MCLFEQSDKSKWREPHLIGYKREPHLIGYKREPHLIGYKKKVVLALPSRLQNSASERIVPKLQAQRKKDGAVHIGLFLEICLRTSHLDIWHSLFLHIQIGSTQSIHFVVLLNCCFRLQITVHRLAVLLTLFWRKKTCQKCKHGEMEGGRIQIIFILR